MEFITSAVGRLARAIGITSDDSDSRLQSRNIIHVAFLLHQKLPADLVPMILEYAELWETIKLDIPHVPDRCISQHESPWLCAAAIVPYYIPRGRIRVIRFITVSKDQGWSDYREHHNTYEGSYSWFEAGVIEPRANPELECGHERYEGDHLRQCLARPLPCRWGNKRIVTNVHAGRDDRKHVVEWKGEDEDEGVRQMMRVIEGGYSIEVSARAQYQGWINYVRSVQIEIECAVVRKL